MNEEELTRQEREILRAIDRMQRIQLYRLCPDVTPPEGRMLGILAGREEGLTVSALAAEMDLPASMLSRIMRSAEQRGMIERRIVPTDRRSILVTATDQGREISREIDARFHRLFSAVFSSVDAEQFDQMMSAWVEGMNRMEEALRQQLAEQAEQERNAGPRRRQKEDSPGEGTE